MFWIICILVTIIDFILIKQITKNDENSFDENDKFLPAFCIIGPFIPGINLMILIIISIYFMSEIKWSKIFYKIYGKK